MSASSDQQWESQIKEKDKSLRKVTLDACFRTKNSEGFQAYFRSVALNPALSNGSDTVNRFIASLDPLRSFTTAASAASQDEEGVHIIWAALHALIEVSCQLLFTTSRLCVTKWLRWRRCTGRFPLYRDIQNCPRANCGIEPDFVTVGIVNWSLLRSASAALDSSGPLWWLSWLLYQMLVSATSPASA